jgi:alpha-glucosidase
MDAPPWWQRGVIYHIYSRSWMDADGDGVGDLPGILSRLDHLTWLGVDAFWISPVYPSPGADLGYDVADYTAIDPLFGTMDDMDRLIAAAHERGLRVLLDWVPNHTSDQHPWFLASRSSRDDPKRDWYVWRDPAPDGGPPNNWIGYAGQSAWVWDEATGQYYYRFFLDTQPDLNWRNPEVQTAMLDTLRFWLERGVDGFRIDVLSLLVEDDQLRDNLVNPEFRAGDWPYLRQHFTYTHDQPETRELAMRIRKVADEYGADKVLLAELVVPIEALAAYHGTDGDGIQVPFNFELLEADWNARGIAGFVDRYLAALPAGAWPNWVLGNHDTPRVASRVGAAQARVAAMLLLTLPGTPVLYYGDEIGMADVPIPADAIRDPIAGLVPGRGRDPERTPMRWDDGPGAGFTTGTPWLPLGGDARTVNVAAQRDDPGSMLTLHHRLLALRRSTPALATGAYEAVEADGDVLAYLRTDGGDRWLIALNLGTAPGRVRFPATSSEGGSSTAPGRVRIPAGEVVLSTAPGREGERAGGELALAGDEGVVVRLD